jgi:copper ion binding protein
MKFIIPLFFIFFISLSGCKTASNNSGTDTATTADTASLSFIKAEFKVNGMHCTGCENTIKTNIGELDGIKLVEASFKDSNAVVSFDSAKTNEIAIVHAIEDAGYKVDTFMRK